LSKDVREPLQIQEFLLRNILQPTFHLTQYPVFKTFYIFFKPNYFLSKENIELYL
jgi:hypothetical protein